MPLWCLINLFCSNDENQICNCGMSFRGASVFYFAHRLAKRNLSGTSTFSNICMNICKNRFKPCMYAYTTLQALLSFCFTLFTLALHCCLCKTTNKTNKQYSCRNYKFSHHHLYAIVFIILLRFHTATRKREVAL